MGFAAIYSCFWLSIFVQLASGSRLRRQDDLKKIARSLSYKAALAKVQSVLPEDLVVQLDETAKPPFSGDELNMHTLVSSRSHRLLGLPASSNSNSFTQLGKSNPKLVQHLREGGYPMHCSTPVCSREATCKGAMCCNTVMYEALSSITSWMDQHKVEYVVLDGTLLGAARDKDVIPWTADLDIGISAKDVPKLLHQKDIPFNFAYKQEVVIPRGCEAHNPGFPGNYHNSTPSLHTLAYGDEAQTGQGSYYIDIYPFETFSEFYKDFDSGCLQRNHDGTIRNTTVQIRDRKFKAPLNIEACLVEWYGKTWRTPTHEHGNDVVVAESEGTAKTGIDALVDGIESIVHRAVHFFR